MFTTTLNKIHFYEPCPEGWQKLLKSLGKTKADAEPVSFRHILMYNGIYDAIWALRTCDADHDNVVRLYTCFCAWRALSIVEDAKFYGDKERKFCAPEIIQAITESEHFAYGFITVSDLARIRQNVLEFKTEQNDAVITALATIAMHVSSAGVRFLAWQITNVLHSVIRLVIPNVDKKRFNEIKELEQWSLYTEFINMLNARCKYAPVWRDV